MSTRKRCLFWLTVMIAVVEAQAEIAVGAGYDPLAIPTKPTPAWQDLIVKDEVRAREIPLRVYLPAESAATPVVLFSHGLGGLGA